MPRLTTTYRIAAAIVILVVLTGTRGVVIISHSCINCGTHDYNISLRIYHSPGESCPAEKQSGCTISHARHCDESDISNTTMLPADVDESYNNSCCSHEITLLNIEIPGCEINLNNHAEIQATQLPAMLLPSPFLRNGQPAGHTVCNKHGTAARDIITATCCLLI